MTGKHRRVTRENVTSKAAHPRGSRQKRQRYCRTDFRNFSQAGAHVTLGACQLPASIACCAKKKKSSAPAKNIALFAWARRTCVFARTERTTAATAVKSAIIRCKPQKSSAQDSVPS